MADDSDCDREFDRYESERSDLRKAELDAERHYDQTISTLAALALAVSLTIFKDFIGKSAALAMPLMIFAWLAFAAALIVSLYHRKLTYETHKAWRELLDKEFKKWSPGAWERAEAEYDKIPGIKRVERLKSVGYWLLIVGSVLLTAFIFVNYFYREHGNGNAATDTATTTTTTTVTTSTITGRTDPASGPASRPTERLVAPPATQNIAPSTAVAP